MEGIKFEKPWARDARTWRVAGVTGAAALSLTAALAVGAPAVALAATGATAAEGQVAAPTATVNGSAYTTIADAVAAAKDGDTVELAGSFANENVAVTKSLAFKGAKLGDAYAATLDNVVFTVSGKAKLGLDTLEFTGDSKVLNSGASAFSLKNSLVNTTISGSSDACSFFYGTHQEISVKFTIEDNQIARTSKGYGAGLIGDWCSWANDSVVSGNTFGTSSSGFFGKQAFCMMNIDKGATVSIKDNTFYLSSRAFKLYQCNGRANKGTVLVSGNASTAGYTFAQIDGLRGNFTNSMTVLMDSTNTLNGKHVTLSNISGSDKASNYGLLGVDVSYDASGKIASGSFALGTPADAASSLDAMLAEGVTYYQDLKTVGVENAVAQVTSADGATSLYPSLAEAVEAANASDGATVTLLQSVTDHTVLAFSKKVTVTAAEGVTCNGTVRVSAAGSQVKGITFVQDGEDLKFNDAQKYVSGVQNSVIIGQKATGVEVSGCSFTIPSLHKGNTADFQPNAIWVSQGASGSVIKDNTFNLGRAQNNSTVAINFVGGAGTNVIDVATVSGNTFTRAKDAENVTSGSTMFVVANGNSKDEGVYGVKNLVLTDNTIDGAGLARAYGISVSDVDGLTVKGGALKGLENGVRYSVYSEQNGNKNVVVDSVTFEDVQNAVNFAGLTPASEVSFAGENVFKASDVAIFRNHGFLSKMPEPVGMVFAGWYKDAAFTTPLASTDKSGVAYARFVKMDTYTDSAASEHEGIINFMGGSLRYDKYGATEFSKTDMRYGYAYSAPGDAKIVSWGWKWGFSDSVSDLKYKVEGSASRLTSAGLLEHDPSWAASSDMVSNLVIARITSGYYGTSIYVQPYVVYETPDGTQVTVTGDAAKRSVAEVAGKVVKNGAEGSAQCAYAQGLLDAMNAEKE